MSRVKLVIAYDGTDFSGWQIQKNARSVQDEIEKALAVIHDGQIRVTGSGRTDQGVHARGQVAHFSAEQELEAERYVPALNSRLPDDIRILKAETAPDDFHARYDAVRRCYKYYLSEQKYPDLFQRKYCTGIGRSPDLNLLNRYAAQIVGVHDFTTFAAAGDKSKSKVREIFSAAFYREGEYIVFKICGNAFLWKMVRSITGTMIELEAKNRPEWDMKEILEAADRNAAGITAGAKGLFLEKVYYD